MCLSQQFTKISTQNPREKKSIYVYYPEIHKWGNI